MSLEALLVGVGRRLRARTAWRTHTLVVRDDVQEMATLFHVTGPTYV
jgi:hypothetical protein